MGAYAGERCAVVSQLESMASAVQPKGECMPRREKYREGKLTMSQSGWETHSDD